MSKPPLFQQMISAEIFAAPNVLFVFGVFLLLGVLGAILTHKVRFLPTITAFMLIGVAIGPSGVDLITQDILFKTRVIIDVALGLILYKLGVEVQLRHLLRSTSIWRTSILEMFLSFTAVFAVMQLFDYGALLSCFVAAIIGSSSPAVLVHMAEEMRAKGATIYHTKALVALNNVLSFVCFSLIFPFALYGEQFGLSDVIGMPLYRAAGATLIGLVVAFILERVDRLLDKEEEHFRFALITGGIAITLGLAVMLHVSYLFAALILGIATKWMETQRQGLSTIEFGSTGDIFFIALFVMAGASMHAQDVKHIGFVVILIALVRGLAKMGAMFISRYHSQQNKRQTMATTLMLMPAGALAIGLAQTLQNFVPDLGSKVATIIFALVAILETLGPFAVSKAIKMSGESPLYPLKTVQKAEAAQAGESRGEENSEETSSEEDVYIRPTPFY